MHKEQTIQINYKFDSVGNIEVYNDYDHRTVYLQSQSDKEDLASWYGWINVDDDDPNAMGGAVEWLLHLSIDSDWIEDPGFFD